MSISIESLRVEPPQENDDRQYLTDFDGEFWPLCMEDVLTLDGEARIFPKGTPVWIVLRANRRILLQTADEYKRGASREFLQTMKKSNA